MNNKARIMAQRVRRLKLVKGRKDDLDDVLNLYEQVVEPAERRADKILNGRVQHLEKNGRIAKAEAQQLVLNNLKPLHRLLIFG